MIDLDRRIEFKQVDFDPFEEDKIIDKIILMSEPQKEIWLSCILGGHEANLAYNESISLDLQGVFHPGYFKEAVQEVISRHEALRATISASGEFLIIYKFWPLDILVEDITTAPAQKELLTRFITTEMQQEFDLQKGPLFRVFLHKLSETHYYLTLIIHHIIGDGWSMGVLLGDISKIYNARVDGIPLSLAAAPQISDYAEDEAIFEFSDAYRQTENYWLNMYKDNVPVTDLPTDYPRPARRTYTSGRIDRRLSLELIESIQGAGKKAGCSLVNTLLSTFEIFLYLQTGQHDIVVGLPAAGQSATGKFGLVGHCVNLLPIRSSITPEISFNTYLKNRKVAFFDAYDNQRFTYGQLVKLLNIKRDHSRIPIVPVVFNIDMGMDDGVTFSHLDFRLISNPRAAETFEIFLNAAGSKSCFTLEWSYNTQLFKAATIEKMAADFEVLLKKLAGNPDVILKDLQLSPVEDLKEQLELWNDTSVDYQKNSPLSELIDQTALSYPYKTAISYKDKSITYTDLIVRSNQFAAFLIAKGIKAGDIIGLAADRSIEMVVALLGILKAGAVYVPLDPEYPHERVMFMLSDSNAKMLLVSDTYSGLFNSGITEIILEEVWPGLRDGDQILLPRIKGTDLAYVLYTSGSTGKPKGVKIMHHNLVNFLTGMQSQPGINPTDKLLAITTISFDIAGLELYLPLITGAEVVICDTETARDGRLLLDRIASQNITIMQATPSTWRMMTDSGWHNGNGLKILCGGEALPKDLADTLLKRSAELWNMYGPTETTIWSTVKRILPEDKVLTIGRPIQNTQIHILDQDHQPVVPGAVGEICIGGDGVAAGYLNRAELTEERFISDPFSADTSARLYKTGDLGKFMDNGEIQCLGRIDQQVKIRGHRIELGEIESVLQRQAEVKQCVVIAREDNPGDQRLVAYVSQKSGPAIGEPVINTWREALKQQLPDYMVPHDFVVLDTLPLTPNNKIDRKALPKPQSKASVHANGDRLPQNINEKLIADIWSSVLGLKNIDIKADFFEMGGHSLLAVKAMAAIEHKTGKRLPLATLFENATIEKLAKKIGINEQEKWEALVPIKTSGTKTPVYLVHGAGLNVLLFKSIATYLDKDQPVYGLQALGLNKPTQLRYTMEEIAAAYISEIIESNPSGPYCLAGYSLGGFIAFEMARQLTAMGKEIKFLGVLDTYADDLAAMKNNPLGRKIKRQFNKIPFFIRSFLSNPKDAFMYQLHFIEYRIRNLFSDANELFIKQFTPHEKKIYKSYDIAHGRYTLVPSHIKISLFKVKKRLYYLDDLVYLGWDKYADKGVEIYDVPGDHETFLLPPNDRAFAKVLQDALDNIQ